MGLKINLLHFQLPGIKDTLAQSWSKFSGHKDIFCHQKILMSIEALISTVWFISGPFTAHISHWGLIVPSALVEEKQPHMYFLWGSCKGSEALVATNPITEYPELEESRKDH